MRLLAFDKDGTPTLAVRRGDEIVDLTLAAPELPRDVPALLAAGAAAMERVGKIAFDPPAGAVRPAAGIRYWPPVWNAPKYLGAGLNYHDHAREQGVEPPKFPILFPRWAPSLVGHEEPLVCPLASHQFDWECELAVVIGRGGRHIARDDALDHVAFYAAFNDGSIRDYQNNFGQWAPGKNFDASGSFGPDLVTPNELPAGARGLRIATRLNGRIMQNSNTDQLIFDVAALIEKWSVFMTLVPGDVIATGTPAGVGFTRKPPVFMKAGDVCEVEIEGVGILRNPVVDEAEPESRPAAAGRPANEDDGKVESHYAKPAIGASILAALREDGKDPDNLRPHDLAGFGEMHVGGHQATRELAMRLRPGPEDRLLDVGCGIGAPSRHLAMEYGCHVTGVDLTAEFCKVAEMLAQRLKFDERLDYRQGDALDLPFDDQSFDMAWTLHAAMNIADKPRLYAEIFRVLKPGGKFGLYDAMAGAGGTPHYPTPWAPDESISFLLPPEEVRQLLEATGFEVTHWQDCTVEGVHWFHEMKQRQAEEDDPPMLGPEILLGPDYRDIVDNLARSLKEGRVAVIEAVCRKPG